MKVLLTGGTGFVGSHVLDNLRRRGIPTVAMVRSSSNRKLLQPAHDGLEIREAELNHSGQMAEALEGATHVIHCAGSIKALRRADFFKVNQEGTAQLVRALPATLEKFVYISSLAAAGPGEPGSKITEDRPPSPVSDYGRSKLAAEDEIRHHCRVSYTILRPPAVYGPRDAEFLKLFRSVKRGVLPVTARQELSLVYVEDLAEAVIVALTHPATPGKIYYVTHPEVVTALEMGEEISRRMGARPMKVRIPKLCLGAVCLGAEVWSRVSRQPQVLSLQKYPELVAPAWTCEGGQFERDTGHRCRVGLRDGIARTLGWYQENEWL